jgi:hypothetical protein
MNENLILHSPEFTPKIKQSVRVCKKCGSDVITESSCEACGFQLTFDPMGPPMGRKSFYYIKDEFNSRMGTLRKIAMLMEKERYLPLKMYTLKLQRRLDNLLVFFFQMNGGHKRPQEKKQYYIELRDLINELCQMGKEELVWSRIENAVWQDGEGQIQKSANIIYQDLSLWVTQCTKVKPIENLPGKRIFGCRIGFIIILLMFLVVAVSVLQNYFRYFI